jgi:hypothetical protein
MKALLLTFFSCMLIFSQQVPAKLPKYSVLKTEGGEAYLASVNRLSDQGCRLIVGGKFTILRLETTPPDTYRYIRLEDKGGPVQFMNWLNEQGAHGYLWLARTGMLEKAPHPRNYEYRFPQRRALGSSKGADLSSLREEGYRPVGSSYFFHAIGPDITVTFFEREVGLPADAAHMLPAADIQIVGAVRASTLTNRMDTLAKQGYRFLSTYSSSRSDDAVVMEKCRDDCAGRFEYRHFDAKDAPQVERDLNALSKDGFRVVPDTLHARLHLLERDTREKRAFSYRALHPKDAAELEQALNTADSEGYVPLDFVWHVGWTAEGFLVLEKETTASATP